MLTLYDTIQLRVVTAPPYIYASSLQPVTSTVPRLYIFIYIRSPIDLLHRRLYIFLLPHLTTSLTAHGPKSNSSSAVMAPPHYSASHLPHPPFSLPFLLLFLLLFLAASLPSASFLVDAQLLNRQPVVDTAPDDSRDNLSLLTTTTSSSSSSSATDASSPVVPPPTCTAVHVCYVIDHPSTLPDYVTLLTVATNLSHAVSSLFSPPYSTPSLLTSFQAITDYPARPGRTRQSSLTPPLYADHVPRFLPTSTTTAAEDALDSLRQLTTTCTHHLASKPGSRALLYLTDRNVTDVSKIALSAMQTASRQWTSMIVMAVDPLTTDGLYTFSTIQPARLRATVQQRGTEKIAEGLAKYYNTIDRLVKGSCRVPVIQTNSTTTTTTVTPSPSPSMSSSPSVSMSNSATSSPSMTPTSSPSVSTTASSSMLPTTSPSSSPSLSPTSSVTPSPTSSASTSPSFSAFTTTTTTTTTISNPTPEPSPFISTNIGTPAPSITPRVVVVSGNPTPEPDSSDTSSSGSGSGGSTPAPSISITVTATASVPAQADGASQPNSGPGSPLTLPIEQIPFGVPSVTSAANLPPLGDSLSPRANALAARAALELFVYDEIAAIYGTTTTLIRSSVTLTPYDTSFRAMRRRWWRYNFLFNPFFRRRVLQRRSRRGRFVNRKEEDIEEGEMMDIGGLMKIRMSDLTVFCHSNQCAAKVVVWSNKSVRATLIDKAVKKLRRRDGFRQVFIVRRWLIETNRLRRNKWEIVLPYKLSYRNSNID